MPDFDIDAAKRILVHDLDPDFVEFLSKQLAWEYREAMESGFDALEPGFCDELLRRGRNDCAVRAMVRACRRFGVPYEFRRLSSNGQRKLLVKAGRVVLIQEPITSMLDGPKIAQYKQNLAEVHGYIQQLELDLGDQPLRIRDWSGTVLATLLHGHAGVGHGQQRYDLGVVTLGVPEAAYRRWMIRIDLHQIAMFGRRPEVIERSTMSHEPQPDFVKVKLRRKSTSSTGVA